MKKQNMCLANSNMHISYIIASKMSHTMLYSRKLSFENMAGFVIQDILSNL